MRHLINVSTVCIQNVLLKSKQNLPHNNPLNGNGLSNSQEQEFPSAYMILATSPLSQRDDCKLEMTQKPLPKKTPKTGQAKSPAATNNELINNRITALERKAVVAIRLYGKC